MKWKNKYRLILYKSYLDKGLGLTYYIKYLILLFGLTTQDVIITFILAASYGAVSFLMGWLFFKYKWIEAEQEVSNKYNKFVREMRRKI